MLIKKAIFIPILFLLFMLTACSTENGSNNQDKINIYTTVFPITDFTKKIGGDNVNVESVYPPGTDAHSFEPTPREMTKIAEADLFIFTGVGVEGFVESAKSSLKNEKVIFIEAGKGIDFLHSEEHSHNESDHDHESVDPHIWLDPIYSITLAENIKDALIEIKPEAKAEFEKRFLEIKDQLEILDTEFKQVIDQAKKKEILVAHAAYGYWSNRYGIEQISITGFSPTQEPSQQQLLSIIEEAKEHKIDYVLFEQNVHSKIAETVQKELGAQILTLHNLEAITDEEISKKEDYFSLMNKNLETLKTALN